MFTRLAASALTAIAVTLSAPVFAAGLPGIKITPSNAVPACATPGRLMSFLKSRNSRMDSRYDQLAVYYMRHGEDLGIRWDIAFFQMLLETANVAYTGDVNASQNNFAGLGAIGGGAKGESFPDIDRGVRAHLEHVLMYAGDTIENPVAERTRKVQEWDVLTSWRRRIKGPITFSHLGKQWAPGSRGYTSDIEAISDLFYDGICKNPDPQPQLVALARGERQTAAATKATTTVKTATASSADLVAAVISRRTQNAEPAGLGGPDPSDKTAPAEMAATVVTTSDEQPAEAMAATVINSQAPAGGKAANAAAPSAEKTAMVAGEAKKAAPAAKTEPKKCRVWTASYGGAKAIIIKAVSNDVINYTVLDVNAGKEKREAEAYIAAYAKGGETLEEFVSASAALDKAFELCPEG